MQLNYFAIYLKRSCSVATVSSFQPKLEKLKKNIRKAHCEKDSYIFSKNVFLHISGKWSSYISGNESF